MSEGRGSGCGSNSTAAVGSKPVGASPYGVLDMAGNVWEWTADWYSASYYESAPTANPRGPAHGNGYGRVIRGGSFDSNPLFHQMRASVRADRKASSYGDHLGVRCAR